MSDIPRYFQGANGRDAERTQARVHPASRDPHRPRRLDHRRHRCEPRGQSLLYALQDMPGVSDRRPGGASRGKRSRSFATGAARLSGPADLHAYRVRAPRHAYVASRLRSAGRQELLSGEDSRIHDARRRPRGDPCARRIRSEAPAHGHARGHDRDGIQRGLFRLPRLLAIRSAISSQDAAGAVDARRLDREALRRQGVAVLRLATAGALHHRAGARRLGAVLHRRPWRSGPFFAQYLRPAEPSAVQPDGAHAARIGAPATLSRFPLRWSTRINPSSASTPTSRPTERAGRSTANGSARKWACTRRPTTASAC